MVLLLFLLSVLFSIIPKKAERCKSRTQIIGKIDFQEENNKQILLQKTAVELAQLGGVIPHSVGKCPAGTKGQGIL